MSVVVEVKDLQKARKIEHRGLKEVVKTTLTCEKSTANWEVSLLLVDNEYMKKLNCRFRNIPCATDVLAFPQVEDTHPGGNSYLLGDIVISVEKAIEQSAEYKVDFFEEMARLLIHGLLHLLGYSDYKVNERRKMFKRQEEILAMIKKNTLSPQGRGKG